MAFRFVHTADLHLDSPLRSLALRRQELADLVGAASRNSLSNIVQLCLDEKVDALLIGGDLYDGEQTSMKTARFLADELGRLHQAGIRTFIIRGNHDALSKITKQLMLPETVHVFGGKAGISEIENAELGFSVHIHGLSFKEATASESLLPHYRPAVSDAVNIGLMHTSLDGSPAHDIYAPCKVTDLQATGFNYWALGHIHSRRVITGRCTIVMPGMTQGRDVGETGAKSVSLVTIADDRSLSIEERFVSSAEFAIVAVDMTGIAAWKDALSAIEKGFQKARLEATSEALIARLRIEGTTPLAARLRWDHLILREEAERAADAIGGTYVEKLQTHVQETSGAPRADGNPVPELRHLIETNILTAEGYQEALLRLADELKGELPRDCVNPFAGDPDDVRKLLHQLASEGVEDVLARLQQSPEASV